MVGVQALGTCEHTSKFLGKIEVIVTLFHFRTINSYQKFLKCIKFSEDLT